MKTVGNTKRRVQLLAQYATSYAITPGWHLRALCRNYDPDLWFPGDKDRAGYHKARQICIRCPVIQECLADALTSDLRHGMFGGLTPRERAKLQDPNATRKR